MKSIIDKSSLGKVIAEKMPQASQPELFLEWVNRPGTSMADVLKWATEDDIIETEKRYNELPSS